MKHKKIRNPRFLAALGALGFLGLKGLHSPEVQQWAACDTAWLECTAGVPPAPLKGWEAE